MKQFWIFDFRFSIGRSTSKKVFGFLLSAMLFALSSPVEAQQSKKIPRIGYLSGSDPASESARAEAIRQVLRERGYIEGQNIATEYRYAEGKRDRFPAIAAELVRLKVEIILVAGPDLAVRAAMNATKTIPIVMTGGGLDPVEAGLVRKPRPSRRQRHRAYNPYGTSRR